MNTNFNTTNNNSFDFASIADQLGVTEDAVKAALASKVESAPVLPSTKNLPAAGNNSSIFEQDFDNEESEGVEVLGQFFIGKTSVVWRNASMTLNPEVKGYTHRFFTKMETAGVLGALSGIHQNRYEILEVGAHFFKAERPRVFSAERVGYMTFAYNGTNPELLRLRPERGVNIIGIKNGAYVVTRSIPIMGYEHHGDEPKWVTENRQAYYKHIGMDLILTGQRIFVSPTMYKNGVKSPENRALYLARFAESFCAEPEEAVKMYENVVVAKNAKRHEAAVATKIKTGAMRLNIDEEAFMNVQVPVGNGAVLSVKDLMGQRVYKMMGNVKINSNPIEVTEANVKTLVAMTERNRGMSLVLAK